MERAGVLSCQNAYAQPQTLPREEKSFLELKDSPPHQGQGVGMLLCLIPGPWNVQRLVDHSH